jgi:phosphoribosylglycinamide formyltransferase-1
VVSNNSGSGILAYARASGFPALHISEKQYASRDAFARALMDSLETHGATFIVLAGYLKRLPGEVVARYRGRIINIHPALLPKFGGQGMYGMHVHRAVLDAHEPVSGATVHLVDEEYDRGPVILQRTVPVMPDDTPETLAARVLTVEHLILPEAIRMFLDGRTPQTNVGTEQL